MENHIKTAEVITYLLENRFTVFKYKFGLDPILGLVPWLGDIITLILSLYLLWIATQLRVPESKLREMLKNSILDFFIGIIPFIGSVGDFLFRSNTKNLKILKEHARVREAMIVAR